MAQLLNALSEMRDTLSGQLAVLSEEVARLRTQVERPDLIKYSVDEAAERLGRSRSSLYNLFDAGEIVRVKERGRTYVTEEEIQRWERSNRIQ